MSFVFHDNKKLRLINNNIYLSESFNTNRRYTNNQTLDNDKLYFTSLYLCKGTYNNVDIIVTNPPSSLAIIGAIYEQGTTDSGIVKCVKIADLNPFKPRPSHPVFTNLDTNESSINNNINIQCSKRYLVCFYNPTTSLDLRRINGAFYNTADPKSINYSAPSAGIVVDGKLPEEFVVPTVDVTNTHPIYIQIC